MSESPRALAAELMDGFARRTGLASERPPRRYLWTDAFAVGNLLGLARATGEVRYVELALALVDQVHRTLGRHRPDDPRRGWISGLGEAEGELHPTAGGLRIGKPLPERAPGEPFDERLEWERDGQYFHYLTRWMVALDLVARATGDLRFHRQARELAAVAHAAFVRRPAPGAPPRMIWKASIDLSRALVPSMGQHDPLDGLVTCWQLCEGAAALGEGQGSALADEIASYEALLAGRELATTDPLGLGSLLVDAWRVGQLGARGADLDESLLATLLDAARRGLASLRSAELRRPAEERLAFRELGLAIGLEAAGRLAALSERGRLAPSPEVRRHLAELAHYLPLRERIVAFWSDPAHRLARTWREHEDIDDVMLATALLPEGFLELPAPR